MRHLLLALMIALLPIRGWMGDAMALSMLVAPAQATMHHPAAAGTDHAMPVGHAQGHDQGAAGMTEHGADMQADGGGEHTHKSCEVCNGPAMALSVPAVPTLSPRHGLLAPPAERFVSSEPHQGIKPPIS
ncbi:MAG: hypothetical protein ACT6UH_00130 [Hydrogenophaga sp.]|uniref:hypothetical protein n=2 Tax=Hydrogenophaga sp. TaxID=1904254 RepID=UPI004035F646